MKLELTPLAEADLVRAGDWYEREGPGLREKFLSSVEEALTRVQHNPGLYQVVRRDIRRAPVRRFPYGVYYLLVGDGIQVIAVVHDARHSSSWGSRTS